MNNKILAVVVMLVLLVVLFAGCNEETFGGGLSDEEKKFVGTWKSSDENNAFIFGATFTFFSDGTGSGSASFEVKDGKLVVSFEGMQLVYEYAFSNSNSMVLITAIASGRSATYTKQ